MFEVYHWAKSIDKASSSINSVLLDLFELSEMFISEDHSVLFFFGELNSI